MSATNLAAIRRFRETTSPKPQLFPRRFVGGLIAASFLTLIVALGGVWTCAGVYGLNVLFRHGGTWWLTVSTTSSMISPSMRLALGTAPVATPGDLKWQAVSAGFETADLPAMVDGHDVDHVLLARIDAARFRFEVHTARAGNVGLDQWMSALHPALVVNGSYTGRDGRPATPILSDGMPVGPREYEARAGAFVGSATSTSVLDLRETDRTKAFSGAKNAMLSFPLLVANGATRISRPSRWLANRSFVGQDGELSEMA